jgi:hypothetical protein
VIYFSKFKNNDYEKLNQFLETKYGGWICIFRICEDGNLNW